MINIPCSTPSAQVHIPLEFLPVLPHLHNTMKLKFSQSSLLLFLMYSLSIQEQHKHSICSLTNEDINTCHKNSHRDACQQDIILLKKRERNIKVKTKHQKICHASLIK